MSSPPSYVDGIKVKISEKYKPPYRIGLPFTYSQRLYQNKQILENHSDYDFSLEETWLQKATEIRHLRMTREEERRKRLEGARKEYEERCEKEEKEREEARSKELEKTTEDLDQLEISEETSTEATTQNQFYLDNIPTSYQNSLTDKNQTYTNSINTHSNLESNVYSNFQSNRLNSTYQNYVTNGILIPTPASSTYSNILTPVPLSSTNTTGNETSKSNNRKLFNLSDFEADTSSPFDNMELKSINDLEELAQVLKSDRSRYITPNENTTQINQPYSNQYSLPNTGYCISGAPIPNSNSCYMSSNTQMATSPSNLNHIPVHSTYSQYSYGARNTDTTINYVPTTVSGYSNLNGYYYNNSNIASQSTNSYGYAAPSINVGHNPYISNQSSLPQSTALYRYSTSNSKSVPDITQSVEDEVAQVNLRTEPASHPPIPCRPKSIDTVYRKTKKKEEIIDPLEGLSEEQKNFCQSIGSMGFPLDRVVRVRNVVGDDYKKIVDHLLGLSDLLDLGFSEKDASDALLNSNNDRDKALDNLIS